MGDIHYKEASGYRMLHLTTTVWLTIKERKYIVNTIAVFLYSILHSGGEHSIFITW